MRNKKLGPMGAVAIIVGGMIGSAIYSLSGMTIYYGGPAAILSWTVAAAILFMYALQVTELSCIFPKSGGVFVFPEKSLGRTEEEGKFWGWISTWGYMNANIGGIAFAAIYISRYLSAGFPIFSDMQIPLAVGACLLLGLLNLLGITVAGRANFVLVIILVGTLVIFSAIGLFFGNWDGTMLEPFFTQGIKGATGWISAIPNAMVAFGSIVAVAFLVSDVEDPRKNVPRATFLAMAIVLLIYLAVILTTLGYISATFLKENAGFRFIPLFAVAWTGLQEFTFLPKLISLSAFLALSTTMLVVTALTARAMSAAADGKMLPKIFAKRMENNVPATATVVTALIAAIISFFPTFTEQIVNFASLFAAVTICINCISLMAAHKKGLSAENTFKCPFGKVIPPLTVGIIIATYIPSILQGGLQLILYTLMWYGLGILIFWVMKQKGRAGS
ncbi:MAG: APC family permease, partial [Spirochaetaceae bacterium]|nr:APC family permease [Spirochaetaceae bacterium]